MAFSDELRVMTGSIWDTQLTHPFVQALGDGTLPERKFRFYILQDALFLVELAKVFAAAAQKSDDLETMQQFTKLQHDTIMVERALHQDYGTHWNLTEPEMMRTPMAPTNYAYTRHMLHVAATGTLAEVTTVALPCAWIYCVVGRHLLKAGPPPDDHPYRAWLTLYASPEFADVAAWMRGKVDDWADGLGQDERRRIESHFLISSRYEWMFWDMAWREEQWPV